jgi:hypothetical protein
LFTPGRSLSGLFVGQLKARPVYNRRRLTRSLHANQ